MQQWLRDTLLLEIGSAAWGIPQFHTISQLSCAYATNPGLNRARNDDRVAIAIVDVTPQVRYVIAAVCDGVGGSELGHIAASDTLALLISGLFAADHANSLEAVATSLVRVADDGVRSRLAGRGSTTLSMLVARAGELVAVNVGDSRILGWSPSVVPAAQLSIDDTIENELKNLNITDASALDERNLRGRLSQAIGEPGRTSADLRIVPITKALGAQQGVVLATDGAWKGCEPAFTTNLQFAQTGQDAVRRCVASAMWAGGLDNISVLAIEDLSRFASAASAVPRPSGRVEVWFGDARLVVQAPPPVIRTVEERPKPEKPAATKRATTKKAKPDSPIASKGSKAEPVKQDDLPLGSVSGRVVGKKGKVEIATDDADP